MAGLNIGLVARCLNTAHIRGMGRYVYELLEQSVSPGDISWLLFGDDPRYPMTMPDSPRIVPDVFPFRGDRFNLWEQVGLPRRAAAARVDVLHCTEGTLPVWQPVPTVVTVHDTLMWEEHDGSAGARLYFDRVVPAALRRCAAVITISESSRHDILARWPWLEGKLSVIPHGIGQAYFSEEVTALPAALAGVLEGRRYLVYLGGPMERKRFSWAVDVLANARDKSLHLVACGFGEAVRGKAAAALGDDLRGRVHFAPYISEPELRSLYRGASAVLYPTLYEGFGFPAVEAQASGVPVLMSPLGSLKELVGPLALVVPPHDMAAWQAALDEALAMQAAGVPSAVKAKAWARNFMWAESFARHLEVYRRVAAAGRGR